MELGYYNSYMEIDLGIMTRNYHILKDFIGPGHGIIPVLKSNAYGHGTVAMADFYINNFQTDLIACGQLMEGVEIRQAGYRSCDILIMGAVSDHLLGYAVEYDLQFALFTVETARRLSEIARQMGKRPRVQIKIETGLNRIGIRPGAGLDALLDEIKALGNIEICGVFTHFATATTQYEPFVYEQYKLFEQALAQLAPRSLNLKYIHSCNTGAASWFREGFGTHIRVGCVMMGYPSMDDYSNPLGVEEPASWRAFVTHVHDIEAGESCSYNRYFMAEKPTTVATINIGYGDGLYRPLAQKGGPVLVGDTRTRYLATCMDQTFVDVTGIDCKPGDEVTIYGKSRGGATLSFTEVEQYTEETLVYTMLSINHRVKRIYIR